LEIYGLTVLISLKASMSTWESHFKPQTYKMALDADGIECGH